MHAEGESGVVAGYVLGEELAACVGAFATALNRGLPDGFDGQVVVGPGDDGDVMGSRVA